jgi:hypothetical protein
MIWLLAHPLISSPVSNSTGDTQEDQERRITCGRERRERRRSSRILLPQKPGPPLISQYSLFNVWRINELPNEEKEDIYITGPVTHIDVNEKDL